MPFIPRSIGPEETLGVSPDTIRTLHHELAANGFPVSKAETASARFGSDTEARVREIQSRYGLSVTGTLDPVDRWHSRALHTCVHGGRPGRNCKLNSKTR